jgi:hypothetical protein
MGTPLGDHNSSKELTAGAAAFDEYYATRTPKEKAALDKHVKNIMKELPNTGPVQAKYLVMKAGLMIQAGRVKA